MIDFKCQLAAFSVSNRKISWITLKTAKIKKSSTSPKHPHKHFSVSMIGMDWLSFLVGVLDPKFWDFLGADLDFDLVLLMMAAHA